jgi:acetyl esterase
VAGPAPLLVFLHGGGFVFGDLESYDGVCRVLCRHGGMMVMAMEYRLAPEHPFPAPVEDARAALRWVFEHADELGADSLRVAIGGDSAGGSLSAVVSQLAARDGGPAPALQVLIYPAIDPGHAYRSVELFADGFFLTRTEMDFFDEAYAGGIADDPADPRRYPLVGDLSGLATAYVVTAGFDPLRDEGEAYGAALEAAGTPTLVRRYPSLIHGFINMIGISQASRNALVEIAEQVGVLLRGAGGGASETAAAAPTGRRQ